MKYGVYDTSTPSVSLTTLSTGDLGPLQLFPGTITRTSNTSSPLVNLSSGDEILCHELKTRQEGIVTMHHK